MKSCFWILEYNVDFGCWYLASLYREFDSTILSLAAYNAGRGNVKKWLESQSGQAKLKPSPKYLSRNPEILRAGAGHDSNLQAALSRI